MLILLWPCVCISFQWNVSFSDIHHNASISSTISFGFTINHKSSFCGMWMNRFSLPLFNCFAQDYRFIFIEKEQIMNGVVCRNKLLNLCFSCTSNLLSFFLVLLNHIQISIRSFLSHFSCYSFHHVQSLCHSLHCSSCECVSVRNLFSPLT